MNRELHVSYGDEINIISLPISKEMEQRISLGFDFKLLEEFKKIEQVSYYKYNNIEVYSPPQSLEQYKELYSDIEYPKKLALMGKIVVSDDIFCLPYNENFMAFQNSGGLLDGGVCWWHSRFQRAALYLLYYSPGKEIPNNKIAKSIVWKIMFSNEVVEIPGFCCFHDFSKHFQSIIQECMNIVQIVEGVFLFSWIIGLSGVSETTANDMKNKMEDIYNEVNDNGISYTMLQCPGITSHAWLVIDAKKENDDIKNYITYTVIDSNFNNQVIQLRYYEGDKKINFFNYGVPYLQRKEELKKIKDVIVKTIM